MHRDRQETDRLQMGRMEAQKKNWAILHICIDADNIAIKPASADKWMFNSTGMEKEKSGNNSIRYYTPLGMVVKFAINFVVALVLQHWYIIFIECPWIYWLNVYVCV